MTILINEGISFLIQKMQVICKCCFIYQCLCLSIMG